MALAIRSVNACEREGLALVRRSIASCAAIVSVCAAPNFRTKLWAKVLATDAPKSLKVSSTDSAIVCMAFAKYLYAY